MKIICISCTLIGAFFISSCGYFNALTTEYLGNNFALVDGDAKVDRSIIYCTGEGSDHCESGFPVIPSGEADVHGEYVDSALATTRWIEARTIDKNRVKRYWFIDKNFTVDINNCNKISCDSVIKAHLTGPLEFAAFQKKCRFLGVPAKLK